MTKHTVQEVQKLINTRYREAFISDADISGNEYIHLDKEDYYTLHFTNCKLSGRRHIQISTNDLLEISGSVNIFSIKKTSNEISIEVDADDLDFISITGRFYLCI